MNKQSKNIQNKFEDYYGSTPLTMTSYFVNLSVVED